MTGLDLLISAIFLTKKWVLGVTLSQNTNAKLGPGYPFILHNALATGRYSFLSLTPNLVNGNYDV